MLLNRAHLNVGEQPARILWRCATVPCVDTNINATFDEVLFQED
jgi:hypothetical protein